MTEQIKYMENYGGVGWGEVGQASQSGESGIKMGIT